MMTATASACPSRRAHSSGVFLRLERLVYPRHMLLGGRDALANWHAGAGGAGGAGFQERFLSRGEDVYQRLFVDDGLFLAGMKGVYETFARDILPLKVAGALTADEAWEWDLNGFLVVLALDVKVILIPPCVFH